MHSIVINGVTLRLTYGMHTLERLATLPDVQRLTYHVYFLSRLIAFAHENYCKGHDTEPLMDAGSIFDYLEENIGDKELGEALLKVTQKWNESQPAKALVKANDDLKKKIAETGKTGDQSDVTPSE